MRASTVAVALEIEELHLQIRGRPEEGTVQALAPNGTDQPHSGICVAAAVADCESTSGAEHWTTCGLRWIRKLSDRVLGQPPGRVRGWRARRNRATCTPSRTKHRELLFALPAGCRTRDFARSRVPDCWRHHSDGRRRADTAKRVGAGTNRSHPHVPQFVIATRD